MVVPRIKIMKILLINTYFYNRGGDCTYTFALSELLQENGHEVFHWGMKHPKNYQYKYEDFFVDYLDFSELNKQKTISNGIKVLSRTIYSRYSQKKLQELKEVKSSQKT